MARLNWYKISKLIDTKKLEPIKIQVKLTNGDPREIRTLDPLIKSQMLYRLS